MTSLAQVINCYFWLEQVMEFYHLGVIGENIFGKRLNRWSVWDA